MAMELETSAANIEYYRSILIDRTVRHSQLPQDRHVPLEDTRNSPFCFVIGADTQLGTLRALVNALLPYCFVTVAGMASVSQEWQTELEYCEKAVTHINAMDPKPAFVCMCGDLVDMQADLFADTGTMEWRAETQRKQFSDFQSTWRRLDPLIPLVCLCGNHDVGNQPTKDSINAYKSFFGDDFFAFWCNGCYFVCVNSNIYFDSTKAEDLYAEQHAWLKDRLAYARESNARKIFLCSHHPWFLFQDTELPADLTGINKFNARGEEHLVPDSYFSIPPEPRVQVLSLCREYGVDACFSGHYHQNLVSKTSWGMPMIVTGPICNILLRSDAKDASNPDNVTSSAGVRVVIVDEGVSEAGFSHRYETFC